MKISDALHICSRFDAKLISGDAGVEREVRSIDVMEVPELESWAREGLLIITTFYAVQNNPDAQSKIIQTLMDRQAAGIIVKIGRFIEQLPNEIVRIAKEENFPIILLPKEVPYVEILTPLYQQLHSGNKPGKEHSVWKQFEDKSFSMVEEALDDVATIMNCSVYIEDLGGRLLYRSKEFIRDGWRRSTELFSLPSEKKYEEIMGDWLLEVEKEPFLFLEIPGQKSRTIIPMIARGEVIAFVHLITSYQKRIKDLTEGLSKQIANKLYITMMGEFVELQQQRHVHNEVIQSRVAGHMNDDSYVILFFQRDVHSVPFHSSLIDYHCLFRKNIHALIKNMRGIKDEIVFERNRNVYALLSLTNKDIKSTLKLKQALYERLHQSVISDTFIAISSVFAQGSDLERQLKATSKIIEIGKEVYPDERVYSYNKLGMYEFFFQLSGNEEVKHYVDGILSPLYEVDRVFLDTLTVYLQENSNASRTAEKLFVNRRTITNRLQRIKELLGTELDDAENIFLLQFCLKIKKLL